MTDRIKFAIKIMNIATEIEELSSAIEIWKDGIRLEQHSLFSKEQFESMIERDSQKLEGLNLLFDETIKLAVFK